MSFEALNNIASTTRRLIVVLNDNKWSISKNVGAVAEYLNRIVANPSFALIGLLIERKRAHLKEVMQPRDFQQDLFA